MMNGNANTITIFLKFIACTLSCVEYDDRLDIGNKVTELLP